MFLLNIQARRSVSCMPSDTSLDVWHPCHWDRGGGGCPCCPSSRWSSRQRPTDSSLRGQWSRRSFHSLTFWWHIWVHLWSPARNPLLPALSSWPLWVSYVTGSKACTVLTLRRNVSIIKCLNLELFACHLILDGEPEQLNRDFQHDKVKLSLVLFKHFPSFVKNSSGSQSSIKLQLSMFNCRKTQMTVLWDRTIFWCPSRLLMTPPYSRNPSMGKISFFKL